jgi:pimeloyl-ACP methyl ester carboxylesterase
MADDIESRLPSCKVTLVSPPGYREPSVADGCLLDQWVRFWVQLISDSTNDNVVLCGHSLGAVHALILASKLSLTRRVKVVVSAIPTNIPNKVMRFIVKSNNWRRSIAVAVGRNRLPLRLRGKLLNYNSEIAWDACRPATAKRLLIGCPADNLSIILVISKLDCIAGGAKHQVKFCETLCANGHSLHVAPFCFWLHFPYYSFKRIMWLCDSSSAERDENLSLI